MEKITTAASVSAAWRGMSDEEQYTALQKMAWTVRRSGSKRGAEWIQTQDDAMTVAAEAWLRMGAALERNERADEPRPLNLILYSACAQAANTIARREKRYFSATASLTMEDGEMTDLFDMNAVHVLPAPDPEENAVQRDLLARLLQSDEDRSIAGRMAEGLTGPGNRRRAGYEQIGSPAPDQQHQKSRPPSGKRIIERMNNMENKELKEFKEILHEVKDLDRFRKFMLFCMERLERGEEVSDIWNAWVQSGL